MSRAKGKGELWEHGESRQDVCDWGVAPMMVGELSCPGDDMEQLMVVQGGNLVWIWRNEAMIEKISQGSFVFRVS